MSKVVGTIEAKARNGKSIKVNDTWYGAFKAVQLQGADKGDKVSFTFTESVKGDTTFLNIEGNVTILDGAGTSSSSDSGASTSRSNGAASATVGNRDRSIVRQNSLTQANFLLRTIIGDTGVESGLEAEEVIELARKFEAYSMGEV